MRKPRRLRLVLIAAAVGAASLLAQLVPAVDAGAATAPPLPETRRPATRSLGAAAPTAGAPGGTESPAAPDARAGALLMSEGFESTWPRGLWTVLDANGTAAGQYYWDEDDFKPHAGSYSAWAANGGANGMDPASHPYPIYVDSWMVYGPFDLTSYPHANLAFWYWNRSEQNADYFFWGASVDDDHFFGNEVSGDSEGWRHEFLDLSDWAGEPEVWVAFVFQSDGYGGDTGPFVDEVELWGELPLPGAFVKSSPAAGVTGLPTNPTLSWTLTSGVASYEYCYDTTNDAACSSWIDAGQSTSAALSCLEPDTSYFWQVRAVNPAGASYANGSASAFRRFITGPATPGVCGSEFLVSAGVSWASDDNHPAVAWNATADEYLVVWQDGRYGTRGIDIYGRRYSTSGAPLGDDFRISGEPAVKDETVPAVAWQSSTNEYLVVWQDERNWGTRRYDIYGRRVAADGKLLGDDFMISGAAAVRWEEYPAVVGNLTTGEYLVVWQDQRKLGSRGLDIYGRLVAADGTLGTGDFRISGPEATHDDKIPAVAWNSIGNQYLVVWQGYIGSYNIVGRRLRADGSRMGGDILITDIGDAEQLPAVAWGKAAREYLVVWMDMRQWGNRGPDIYGQRLKANGELAGVNFRAVDGPAGNIAQSWPAVAWNQQAREWLVVFTDSRKSSTRGVDIYGQRLGTDGVALAPDFRISGAEATGGEGWPTVLWNATANDYFALWEDSRRQMERGSDIYGQRVTG